MTQTHAEHCLLYICIYICILYSWSNWTTCSDSAHRNILSNNLTFKKVRLLLSEAIHVRTMCMYITYNIITSIYTHTYLFIIRVCSPTQFKEHTGIHVTMYYVFLPAIILILSVVLSTSYIHVPWPTLCTYPEAIGGQMSLHGSKMHELRVPSLMAISFEFRGLIPIRCSSWYPQTIK